MFCTICDRRHVWGRFGPVDCVLQLFTLRAPAEARPEARIRKSSFFPCSPLDFWLKPRFSNSRDLGGHFLLYESSGNLFPTDLVTKTCKQTLKMKVSNSSRQFPRVYRGFPTLSNPSRGSSMMSEGSQPVAPTLHVKKKLITECREKSDHRVPRKKCMSRKKRIHVNKKEAHTCQEKSDHSVARKN